MADANDQQHGDAMFLFKHFDNTEPITPDNGNIMYLESLPDGLVVDYHKKWTDFDYDLTSDPFWLDRFSSPFSYGNFFVHEYGYVVRALRQSESNFDLVVCNLFIPAPEKDCDALYNQVSATTAS